MFQLLEPNRATKQFYISWKNIFYIRFYIQRSIRGKESITLILKRMWIAHTVMCFVGFSLDTWHDDRSGCFGVFAGYLFWTCKYITPFSSPMIYCNYCSLSRHHRLLLKQSLMSLKLFFKLSGHSQLANDTTLCITTHK